MRGERGHTIVEVMVASAILSLLTAICFVIYSMGWRSLVKVDDKSQVLANLQVLSRRVSGELAATQRASVSLPMDGAGVAFLSPGPVGGRQVDAGGRPVWENHVYYYHLGAEERVYRRQESYATPDKTLLETFDSFAGDSLENLRQAGLVTAREITRFKFTFTPEDLLQLSLEGYSNKETLKLEITIPISPETDAL